MGLASAHLYVPLAAAVHQAVDIDSCSSVGKDAPSFSTEPTTTSDLTRGATMVLSGAVGRGGGRGYCPHFTLRPEKGCIFFLHGTNDNK